MPLQPLKYPPLLSLAENPIVFGFKTNNQLASYGYKASITITISALASGTSFTLSFLGNILVFTAATHPDDSGLQYPNPAQGQTLQQWMSSLAAALYSNYLISSNYAISYGSNYVFLQAKEYGSEYNITGATSSPFIATVSIGGSSQTQRPFFNIFTQVLCDGRLIGTDIRPVAGDGRAYFDISEYLRSWFSSNPGSRFLYPESVNSVLIPRPELVKSFSVRYAEYYGEEPAVNRLRELSGYYAIPGGVNAMTQARYNELPSSFWHNLKTKRHFLTWHPGNKRTSADEMQKLYFLVEKAVTITLMVRLYYRESDGTMAQTAALTKQTIGAGAMFMVEICCGYNRLQLDVDATALPAGSTVTGYSVWLVDELADVISEVFTFVMDPRHYENRRTFLFRNSLGVFEPFISTGTGITEADYARVNVNHCRNWDFTNRTPDHTNALNFESQRFTTNSGWLSLEVINWLRDLQLSRKVYEVKDGQLFPIMFTGNTVGISKDNDYLYNMEMEYIHAFTDEHYSLHTGILKPKLPYAIITNPAPAASKPQPITKPPTVTPNAPTSTRG